MAYHVYPSPPLGIEPSLRPNNPSNTSDSNDTPPPDSQHNPTNLLQFPYLEPPDGGKELTIANYAHDRPMRRKQEVVEPHRRLGRLRMSVCVLALYGGRVEERGCADGVACEAEDVEGGEVDCETEGGAAEVV
jgi:hypothetical protein